MHGAKNNECDKMIACGFFHFRAFFSGHNEGGINEESKQLRLR